MKRFQFFLCFVSLALLFSLGFVSAQCANDQRIYKIFADNDHGEVWNGAGGYTDEICFNGFDVRRDCGSCGLRRR